MDTSACYPPHEAGDTSLRLLERVKLQDPQAWQQLVQLYGPVIRYWMRRAGVARHDQADVFQDAFVAIHRNVATFQANQGAACFRAWLKAVALSKIADYFRREGKRPAASGGTEALLRMQAVPEHLECLDVGQGDLAGDEEGVPTREALRIVREEFQDQTWQAFWRTAVDGCNASEVAADLGITPVAVRKAKSRVLSRLRAFLEATTEDIPIAAAGSDDSSSE